MGINRFEDKIKELQAREIAPTSGSWDKLSASLDAKQEKKKPLIFWMGIAATIIGGILILSLVFNNTTPSNSPEIVDVPKEKVNSDKDMELPSKEIFTDKQEVAEVAISENIEELVPENNERTSSIKNREKIVVLNNKALHKSQKVNIAVTSNNDKILELSINDALANVLAKTKNVATVTDAEVNELLAEAASKISQERYKTDYAVGKVNAEDLLQDVEFEMDNSFRDRIFEILKEGYSRARTAVANRNY